MIDHSLSLRHRYHNVFRDNDECMGGVSLEQYDILYSHDDGLFHRKMEFLLLDKYVFHKCKSNKHIDDRTV